MEEHLEKKECLKLEHCGDALLSNDYRKRMMPTIGND